MTTTTICTAKTQRTQRFLWDDDDGIARRRHEGHEGFLGCRRRRYAPRRRRGRRGFQGSDGGAAGRRGGRLGAAGPRARSDLAPRRPIPLSPVPFSAFLSSVVSASLRCRRGTPPFLRALCAFAVQIVVVIFLIFVSLRCTSSSSQSLNNLCVLCVSAVNRVVVIFLIFASSWCTASSSSPKTLCALCVFAVNRVVVIFLIFASSWCTASSQSSKTLCALCVFAVKHPRHSGGRDRASRSPRS